MSCVELLAVLVQGGNEVDGKLQAGEGRLNSLVRLHGICELPDELKGTDIEQPCLKQRFHVDGHAPVGYPSDADDVRTLLQRRGRNVVDCDI